MIITTCQDIQSRQFNLKYGICTNEHCRLDVIHREKNLNEYVKLVDPAMVERLNLFQDLDECLKKPEFYLKDPSRFAADLVNIMELIPHIENFEEPLRGIAKTLNSEYLNRTITNYINCDRIIENQEMLDEYTEYKSLFVNMDYDDVDSVIIEACDCVNELDYLPLGTRFSVSLENIIYSLDNMMAEYDKEHAVRLIFEYFSCAEEYNYDEFAYIIENTVIDYDDPKRIMDMRNIRDFDESAVLDFFKKSKDKKDPNNFQSFVKSLYQNDPKRIVLSLPNIFNAIMVGASMSMMAINIPLGILSLITHEILKVKYNRESIEKAIKQYKKYRDKAKRKMNNCTKESTKKRYKALYDKTEADLEKLKEYRQTLYSDEENEKINDAEFEENTCLLPTDDYELRTMIESSMIEYFENVSFNDMKIITENSKEIMDTIKNGTIKTKEGLINVIKKLYTNDPKKGVVQLPFIFNLFMRNLSLEIMGIANPVIGALIYLTNEILTVKYNKDIYKRILNAYVNFGIKLKNKILNTKDKNEKKRYEDIAKQNEKEIKKLEKYKKSMMSEEEIKEQELNDNIYCAAAIMDTFLELYTEYINNPYDYIDTEDFGDLALMNIDDSYITEDSSIYEKMIGLENILEECNADVLNEDVAGFGRLKMLGIKLKEKIKGLSDKEKAISQRIDYNYDKFLDNINKKMINKNRESVIKGSILPSFSGLLKLGIGSAGVGAVTMNPILGAITFIGGLACSKFATEKERNYIKSEIDVQLEVVDKKLQLAENNNDMKAYEDLLRVRKKLRQEKQRITYNGRARNFSRNYN